jgi:tartrate-resistant acid phosphatase type 5
LALGAGANVASLRGFCTRHQHNQAYSVAAEVLMRLKTTTLAVALALSAGNLPRGVPVTAEQVQAQTVPMSEEVLSRLPAEWRQPAGKLLKATTQEQQRLSALPEDVLRQNLARLLVRSPGADAFLRQQVVKDPSSRVRTTIVQAIAADARWIALPDTAVLIEHVVSSDADPVVSLAALETLRRSRMRTLNTLLNERIKAAKTTADGETLRRLAHEQERWINLERGSMLPAFLTSPPPVFRVKAEDARVRVLAFGDFGNGSAAQKSTASTIATYHRDRRFDLAVTLGDNFYDRGMESPADPRWETWFEQLYGPLGITFYGALGNHDWGHPDSPAAEMLYSAKSRTWQMPASYYTFTAGPVQFFAIDTQSVALADKQLQWLDGAIASSQARWKIVYGHHPIYSGGAYEDRPDLITRLLPLLRNRVDAIFAGHDHNLQVIKPEAGVHFFIAGGGGAGLYDLRPYERSIFASRSNGFAVIDADRDQLTVSLVDTSGKAVYEETIQKAPLTGSGEQSYSERNTSIGLTEAARRAGR